MSLELSPPNDIFPGAIRPLLMRFFPVLMLFAAYGTIMAEKTSRMYWPYMISSYVIAGLVYLLYEARRMREEPLPALGSYLFSRNIWMHRSTLHDCALFLINYYVFMTFSDYFILNEKNRMDAYRVFYGAIYSTAQSLHIPQHAGKAGIGPIILFTVFTMLVGDLFYYLWHRLTHRVHFLWQFHKIHHSAEVMTPLTYIRGHPFDMWMQNFLRIGSFGVAAGLFYYLYPGIGTVITIAEVDLFLFLLYFFGANLHHSHIWLTYGQKFEHLFISPAQHQIHHSTDPRHYNRNFGTMLALWDWLFGTLYVIKEREKITFGLTGKDREHCETLRSMYFHPVTNLWKMIK
jgi:sterol desaturase/sphingolipid hydroxylase (fatty acid hydroxylase superfamily)